MPKIAKSTNGFKNIQPVKSSSLAQEAESLPGAKSVFMTQDVRFTYDL